ncbi:helix-turn-helix domain-containing protein [Rapidithrix thailandica]|uniref:Helix-turn-helix domain-containing protein n=1 Tax=Rapidithrix thailandica TaxID=413964 RepID=A0AAW9RZX1_9BACT
MKLELYYPSAALQPFIKSYTLVQSDSEMHNHILPDTSLIMAFRVEGNLTLSENGISQSMPASIISGLRKSVRFVGYSKNSTALLVKFKEGMASAFFQLPIHRLFGESLDLEDLIPRDKVQALEERLSLAESRLQRIQLVEQFLLSLLKSSFTDPLVCYALQKMILAKGNIKIKDLLSDLPTSRDPFEKKFRRFVGTSPKQFAALLRMKHFIEVYTQAGTPNNLTESAHAAGYYDQPHLIKDFREFTGQSPRDFFKTASFW